MALQAYYINGDPRTIWGAAAGLHSPSRHGISSGCQTCAEVYILLVQLRAIIVTLSTVRREFYS